MKQLYLVAFSLFLLFLAACENISQRFSGSKEDVTEQTVSVVDSGVLESVLLTRVDQLRMRKYPNIKSNILTTLDDNMPVLFMGEETDFEESIGKSRGNWKRVKTLDDRFEGWVYSGEGFVEWMITPYQRDSITNIGKGLKVFGNLTKPEFAEFSGASLTGEPVGSRYSGWYTFDLEKGPAPINDTIHVITRQLDVANKQVKYLLCSLAVKDGMPQTKLICRE